MSEIDPQYDDEKLRKLCARYRNKASVMKEICDRRHHRAIRHARIRDFVTVTASSLFLGLTFFGASNLAAALKISEDTVTVFISLATFLLLASSIWQLASDRGAVFKNYGGIQAFASLTNKIDYVTSGRSLDVGAATYWAKEIVSLFESAARDIPRITDGEYKAAKKAIR